MATFMAKTMGDFYLTMTERDLTAFTHNAEKYLVLVMISAALDSACQYASEILYVRWRYTLTNKLTADYMADQAYYRLTIEVPAPHRVHVLLQHPWRSRRSVAECCS